MESWLFFFKSLDNNMVFTLIYWCSKKICANHFLMILIFSDYRPYLTETIITICMTIFQKPSLEEFFGLISLWKYRVIFTGKKKYNFKAILYKNIKELLRGSYVPNLPEVQPRRRVLKTWLKQRFVFRSGCGEQNRTFKASQIIAPIKFTPAFGKNFKFFINEKKIVKYFFEGWSYAD